jgi:hypothetical protein
VPDTISDLTDSLEILIIAIVLVAAVGTVVQVVAVRKSAWAAVPVALAGAIALWMVNSVDEIAWWVSDAAHGAHESGDTAPDRGQFETGTNRDYPDCRYWGPSADEDSNAGFMICPYDHPQVDGSGRRGP